VIIPKMSGKALHDELLAARPGLKALYISGYPQGVIAQHGVLEAGIHLLRKPFTASELAQKVREVLSA